MTNIFQASEEDRNWSCSRGIIEGSLVVESEREVTLVTTPQSWKARNLEVSSSLITKQQEQPTSKVLTFKDIGISQKEELQSPNPQSKECPKYTRTPSIQSQRRQISSPLSSSAVITMQTALDIPSGRPKQQQHQRQEYSRQLLYRHPPSSTIGVGLNKGTFSTKHRNPEERLHQASMDTRRDQRKHEEHVSKEEKNQFLLFTQVLMMYLEHIDPAMHAHAKIVLRKVINCNHSIKEPQMDYVLHTMKSQLRATVGAYYWTRAEIYLKRLQQKCREEHSALDISWDAAGLLLTSLSLFPQIPRKGTTNTHLPVKSLTRSVDKSKVSTNI